MNLINKEFKESGTGDIYKIIDVYQNIAIVTSKSTPGVKEKIDVNRLSDPRFYTLIGESITQINQSPEIIDNKKFTIQADDYIDPNKFFNNDRNLALFADQIKSIPEDKLPKEDTNVTNTSSFSPDMMPSTNESAIIIDDEYDEREELARKYGVTNVNDTIRAQNEKFAKLVDPEDLPDIAVQITEPIQPTHQPNNYNPPVQHIKAEDPITTMFKNVKRTVNFNLDIKIENKIPRLDFIEMMEDSYQVSIIEFLSEEFAEELLRNPNGLKKMISDKIRSLVYKESPKVPIKAAKVAKVAKKSTKRVIKKDKISNDTGNIS